MSSYMATNPWQLIGMWLKFIKKPNIKAHCPEALTQNCNSFSSLRNRSASHTSEWITSLWTCTWERLPTLWVEVAFLFLHVVCYSSRFFFFKEKNENTGEDSGATQRQEMLVSDSRKLRCVNRDSESNKPLCDAALTGLPDNAAQGQNKSALLTQAGYYLLCPQLSQNK